MARALLVAMLVVALPVVAGADATLLVGTWRGESLCTVKPSACHDEIVVYHVAKAARPDVVTITGNKVVDGKEVTMGVFDCTWDAPKKTLSCPIPRGVFVYHVEGRTMRGTLTLTDGSLFRRISAERVD